MALNIRKLVSISTQLSMEACRVIRTSLITKSFKSYMKGEDDPVTDIDILIQSMLVKGFNMHFPNLKIIGQESSQYSGSIEYNYSQLLLDTLPTQSTINQQIQLEQSCLWIDPIDCTLGFINGNVEDVTVLIGLSYKKKPIAGIIGTPFKLIGDKRVYDPIVTIGSVHQKQAFDFNGKQWRKKHRKYPINNPFKIVTSNSRSSSSEINLLNTLGAENIKAGGSGRKIMMVANGEVDAMTYCEQWTHKWDSCAGDAIIKAMGGSFTSPYGNEILYDQTSLVTQNKQGIVAALDGEVYKKCMSALGPF